MKHRILTALFVVFIGAHALAQSVNNMVIFSQSGEKFYLILNGVRQNMEPETNVKMVNLDQPAYKVKVIFENKALPNVDKSIAFPEFGKEYVFQVKNKKGKYNIGYVSETSINKDAKAAPDQKIIYFGQPSADTVITTTTTTTTTTNNPTNTNANNNNTTTVNTNNTTTSNTNTSTTTSTTNPNGININITENGINMTGIPVDVNVQTTGTTVNTQQTNNTTTTGNTNSSSNVAVNADNSARYVNNGVMCSSPTLSQDQFVKLKLEIDQRTIVTKMNLTKDNVKKNCMQAAQVAELVKLFDYDSDQLELAKFCYPYTYDTKNYDLVLNALKHDFNKPKLLEVIGSSSGSSSTTTVNNTNVNTNTTDNPSTTTTTTTVVEKKVVTGTNTTATSNGCFTPMSSTDFATAKKSIESKSFEDSKMTIAKQIIKNKCLSTSQVKEIMQLFSFEQSKLDFAKFAYDYTADKDNYYQLNDAFTFESSITELNEYIESK